MKRSDAAIRATWTMHLTNYRRLAAAAKLRHTAAQAALRVARVKDQHPRTALVEVRDRASADLKHRREQIARAQMIIARHKPKASVPTGVSSRGVLMVANFEGFRSAPYRDAVGVWTIGYGETKGIGPGTHPWSRGYAMDRLKLRLDRDYCAPVLRRCAAVGFKPTQAELDALTSLVYNLGPGILENGRTMGNAIASKNRQRIADAFLVYDQAGGRRLAGLTTRRRAERKLFLS